MNEIFFATGNEAKVSTVRKALMGYDLEIKHVPLEIPEPRSDDLKEIAGAKVLYAYQRIKKPCIAIDSGFYIPSLNGFPRTYVNFALETIGVEGMLKLVDGISRDCEFRNCLAYYDGTLDEPVYFESTLKGVLAGEVRVCNRTSWGRLHSVFIPKGFSKTLGEMSDGERREHEENRNLDHFTKKFADWITKN